MIKNEGETLNNYLMRENNKIYKTEKVSFLSHISHGIRTPLNSIMGFSKLLALRNTLDSKQKEYVEGILNGSNLLLQFVDNIMDLSQFEANSYSVRFNRYNINQLLWEFTEEFYNHRIENHDTHINLMLVWDSKLSDFEIETDSYLLKKALKRIISLVTNKFPIVEFEMGYRINEDDINIFVRPLKEKLSLDDFLKEQQLYSVDDGNSFDYFNYKVLEKSVSMLGGKLDMDSSNQEYLFSIPITGNQNNGFNIL